MNQSKQSQAPFGDDGDPDTTKIDLWKIFDFLLKYRKKLQMGMLLGLMGGLSWIFLFNSYQASLLVPNLGSQAIPPRVLQADWSSVAQNIFGKEVLIPSDKLFYSRLASEKWWSTNAIPMLSVTKTDLKDFGGTYEIQAPPLPLGKLPGPIKIRSLPKKIY
uniref:hypothetical protein n=1 Tax=Polynucleobacter sp. TaxID=2029855 RepID=UPI0040482204